MLLSFIRYSTYRFEVTFVDDVPRWVTGLRLEAEYINEQFTLFELLSRIAFFVMTAAFAGYFWWQLRRIPIS